MVAQTASASTIDRLAEQLAERLRMPLSLKEPYIVEDRIPQTRSRHVMVIWDAWKKLTREERSSVVLNAYRSAERLGADTIRVALGLTQQEAYEMGYLPFEVAALVRKADPISHTDAERAVRSIDGIHIKVGASHQLRYPSRPYAEEAYRHLATQLPGPYWTIMQQVPAPSHD